MCVPMVEITITKMVGLAGFEPATSRPPDERATKLRYSPNGASIIKGGGLGKGQAKFIAQPLPYFRVFHRNA